MKITDEQITEFDERGYILIRDLLSQTEIEIIQSAIPEILARSGPEIVRESDNPDTARLAFGPHYYSEPFARLVQLPRIIEPVRTLLRDEVYIHQSRLNPNPGFGTGGGWEWHQDFPPWHTIDGMPEPRCIMVSVFIDD